MTVMFKEILVFTALIVASLCEDVDSRKAAKSMQSRYGEHNLYHIYTRSNPNQGVKLLPDPKSIALSGVLYRNTTTVILIHGHNEGFNQFFAGSVRSGLLTEEDINVVEVNWDIYASQPYSYAVMAVPSVGQHLAQFIQLLVMWSEFRVNYNNIHIVGFNLGAHVAGFAGRSLTVNAKIQRITGLDPSGPQWEYSRHRLNTEDAHYVEIIHTDATENGISHAIGHADFYVNGGKDQPGCGTDHRCSHDMAWIYFHDSLSTEYIGRQCDSQASLENNQCMGDIYRMGTNDLTKDSRWGMFRVNIGDNNGGTDPDLGQTTPNYL